METLKIINAVLLVVSLLCNAWALFDIVRGIMQTKGDVRRTGVILALTFVFSLIVIVLSLLAYVAEDGHEVARGRTTAMAFFGILLTAFYSMLRRGLL